MDKRIKQIEDYCEFENGLVYTLILLPRKKENVNQVERAKLDKRVRFIVANMDDVQYAMDEFDRYATIYTDVVFRIYLSVNRRSLMKGMREFQKRMLDMQYDLINGNEEVYTSINRLGSEWKSTLAKKNCRADRYFMYDIDICNKVQSERDRAIQFADDVLEHTKVKYFGESKNGFCLIVHPFNPNLVKLPDDVERKDDAYMYVACMNEK